MSGDQGEKAQMNRWFDADYLCPRPLTWTRLHQSRVAHEGPHARGLPKRPVPRILVASNFASDQEKAKRSAATRRVDAIRACSGSRMPSSTGAES